MKTSSSLACALAGCLVAGGALAGQISDTGAGAHWGAKGDTFGDVIGGALFDIEGATITRVGGVLTITIATAFAGNAGALSDMGPGGIGYGDVFLAQAWNPYGAGSHHSGDNAINGTRWSYGLNLDNRWSTTGGKFELYALNGSKNANNILNSQSFMTCSFGKNCDYRPDEATAVRTGSGSVSDTGKSGTWTVVQGKQLQFTLDDLPSDLLNFTSYAMHWGETCQNDVIEGLVGDLAPLPAIDPAQAVPAPGSLALLALGLFALQATRRRVSAAAAASPARPLPRA